MIELFSFFLPYAGSESELACNTIRGETGEGTLWRRWSEFIPSKVLTLNLLNDIYLGEVIEIYIGDLSMCVM